jgi:lysozyme family protein
MDNDDAYTEAADNSDIAAIEAELNAIAEETQELTLMQRLVDAQDRVAELLSRFAATQVDRPDPDFATEAPRPDFATLKPRYEQLYASAIIPAAKAGVVAWHRKKLLRYKPRYDEVAAIVGAPWWFIGIVHAMEASFNFAGHLHNGDPLTARTVQVPRGRPVKWNPPSDWVSSAVDAITGEGHAHQSDWSIARTLFRFEGYNGFGYHPRGINSPYLWSFSNHYSKGKFVKDGVFNPNAVSAQCGAAVMLRALQNGGDISL